jgi:hypothetical protein
MLRLYLRHKFLAIEFYFSGYYGQNCVTKHEFFTTVIIGPLLSNLTLSTSSVPLKENCHDSPPQLFYGTSQVTRLLLFFIVVIRIRKSNFSFFLVPSVLFPTSFLEP